MEKTLKIAQIVISVILVIVILLQNREGGLGMAFGGEGNVFSTKRGFEKMLFIFTIILSIAFLGTALANTLLID
ncbi:preprotein translocase subunit SecG [bacterium (Candidatus Torokbacteria) CG_4_10_14_0_2_um_filter_35_8]|nr:MAG: preprotein translocase subunit SecG [bacterium (Candidatus Torokbacteria) CG_4_10_14_0_2_um_filter_35_8]